MGALIRPASPILPPMVDVSEERFEELVGEALDTIPDELARHMDNVAVTVRDNGYEGLLGLYEGVPLTARADYGVGGVMPDRITIFRRPILDLCSTEAEVVRQVRVTVIHEVGHHFGIDDDRLRELGWA